MDSGNYLISRRDPDVHTLNQLAGGVVISENQLREAEKKILRLQDELEESRNMNKQREMELRIELDKQREAKKQLEIKLAGVDMDKVRDDDIFYREMEKNLKDLNKKLESERDDLKMKLNWYIDNQENIGNIIE